MINIIPTSRILSIEVPVNQHFVDNDLSEHGRSQTEKLDD